MPTARTRTREPTELWGTGARTGYEKTIRKSNGALIAYSPYDTGIYDVRILRRRDVRMDDWITPQFFVKKQMGQIINNDLYQRWYDIEASSGPDIVATAVYENSTYRKTKYISGRLNPWGEAGLGSFSTDWGDPTYYPAGPPSTSYETSLRNQAIAEATARVAQAPLNAWVIVGEARETIRTVENCLKAIAMLLMPVKGKSIIRSVRKRVGRHRLITWDDLAQVRDLWLNLRYGLRPLVYDLLGAIKAVELIGNKARQRFASAEYVGSDKLTTSTPQSSVIDSVFRVYRKGSHEISSTIRAGVLVEPYFENLTVLDVIGAGNLAVGLWDLVPYSFVVDWFANVSNVLASWVPNGFANPVASWVITRRKTIRRTESMPPDQLSYINPWNGYNLVSSSGQITTGYVQTTLNEVIRTADPSLPVIPSLTWKLNVARRLDLLALGSQFIHMK